LRLEAPSGLIFLLLLSRLFLIIALQPWPATPLEAVSPRRRRWSWPKRWVLSYSRSRGASPTAPQVRHGRCRPSPGPCRSGGEADRRPVIPGRSALLGPSHYPAIRERDRPLHPGLFTGRLAADDLGGMLAPRIVPRVALARSLPLEEMRVGDPHAARTISGLIPALITPDATAPRISGGHSGCATTMSCRSCSCWPAARPVGRGPAALQEQQKTYLKACHHARRDHTSSPLA